MSRPTTLDRALIVVGTLLAWFPIAATLILSAIGTVADRTLRFDFLMPAELFLFFAVGGLLLSIAAVRLGRRRWTVIGGTTAAVAALAATQGLAVVTGLAHGDAEPTGWRLALVLTMLVLYTVAVIVTAVGGIQLWRDVGARAVPPGP
jgi:hypothetical protein